MILIGGNDNGSWGMALVQEEHRQMDDTRTTITPKTKTTLTTIGYEK